MTEPINRNLVVARALALVRRFVMQCHPTAEAALLAGSQSRREANAGSDHDVVLLFRSMPDGAWREMVLFEGRTVEVFAHDLGALAYFCREVDRPSGKPALPTMIAEGISILSENAAVLSAAREIANQTLHRGPPVLDCAALHMRRYTMTDLATALRPDSERSLFLAVGSALFAELADFMLRAEGCWSAAGKALPQDLATANPTLAKQFDIAFAALFTAGDITLVQALVDDVLQPYGGRLREGYRQNAPASWSDTPKSHKEP